MPGMGAGGMGTPDMNQMAEMMQNPMVQQMVSQSLQNPETLRMMEQMNPQLRQMLDAQPHLRQMMQSPEFLQSVSNPQNLQAMAQMQAMMNTMNPGAAAGGAA